MIWSNATMSATTLHKEWDQVKELLNLEYTLKYLKMLVLIVI